MTTLEDLMAELTPEEKAKVISRANEMIKEHEDRIKAEKLGPKNTQVRG